MEERQVWPHRRRRRRHQEGEDGAHDPQRNDEPRPRRRPPSAADESHGPDDHERRHHGLQRDGDQPSIAREAEQLPWLNEVSGIVERLQCEARAAREGPFERDGHPIEGGEPDPEQHRRRRPEDGPDLTDRHGPAQDHERQRAVAGEPDGGMQDDERGARDGERQPGARAAVVEPCDERAECGGHHHHAAVLGEIPADVELGARIRAQQEGRAGEHACSRPEPRANEHERGEEARERDQPENRAERRRRREHRREDARGVEQARLVVAEVRAPEATAEVARPLGEELPRAQDVDELDEPVDVRGALVVQVHLARRIAEVSPCEPGGQECAPRRGQQNHERGAFRTGSGDVVWYGRCHSQGRPSRHCRRSRNLRHGAVHVPGAPSRRHGARAGRARSGLRSGASAAAALRARVPVTARPGLPLPLPEPRRLAARRRRRPRRRRDGSRRRCGRSRRCRRRTDRGSRSGRRS